MLADGNIRADGTLIQRPTDAGVDKEKGTCSSVSLVSGRASAQTARPATSIATLRCETVTGQAGHRLTDAIRSIGPRCKAPAL